MQLDSPKQGSKRDAVSNFFHLSVNNISAAGPRDICNPKIQAFSSFRRPEILYDTIKATNEQVQQQAPFITIKTQMLQ